MDMEDISEMFGKMYLFESELESKCDNQLADVDPES